MSGQDWTQSQYYQEDFLASHSLQPGSDGARKMTVTSGRKCAELYRKSGPLGSLVRMLLGSSAWRSTRCYAYSKEYREYYYSCRICHKHFWNRQVPKVLPGEEK